MTPISDHGELDYLTPQPTDTDRAIARKAWDALKQQQADRNAADKLRQIEANARAIEAMVGIRP